MPNYPDQYFNTNSGATKSFSNQNKTIIKEERVSGASADNIYVAQLVKVVGASVNLQTGDVNVDLDHAGDTVRLGDGTDLTNVTPGGHLFVSGITSIENVNVSGNSLQTIITDNESTIGAVVGKSIKPRKVVVRPNDSTQYNIGDILSDNTSTPLEFVISRITDKSVFCIGGKATSAISASTTPNINLLLFDTSFTIAADNNLLDLSGGTDIGSMSGWVGTIKFSTWDTISNSMYSEGATESPFVILPSGGTQNIYGIPILANTYTPVANEVFSFSLEIDQN